MDQGPLIISGPCSAESREQLIKTAHELSKIGKVCVFRTGIWKPRTRPGTFEGVGEKGLKWLQEVHQTTGLPVAVEVASPYHLDQVYKYNINMVWIGARTTSNPFSIQELADKLSGTDIPVLVKNPINPDLNLWIGALERFYGTGIRKLAAVHRGFYPFEQTHLRNIPKWELPIELKTRINELPIFCDPSHIAGSREHISEISQKALDLNMDGLMIESHINPDEALSDAQQQLTPKNLEKLLNNLVYRTNDPNDIGFRDAMESLREKIDSIDEQIIELLAKRMDVVGEIAQYKSQKKVTIFQLRRWEKIISSRVSQGIELGLSKKFIKDLLELVHKASIARQTEVMNKIKSGKSEEN
jgi:chorismate mutase